jgi:hypothetical protein
MNNAILRMLMVVAILVAFEVAPLSIKNAAALASDKNHKDITSYNDNSSGFTKKSLQSLKYKVWPNKIVQLRDGQYSNGTGDNHIEVGLLDDVVLGNLNNEKVAVVLYIVHEGEGGNYQDLILGVVRNDHGKLVNIASYVLGEIGVDKIAINNGIIVLDIKTHNINDQNDSHATPSVKAVSKFKLEGNRLVNLTPNVLKYQGLMDNNGKPREKSL